MSLFRAGVSKSIQNQHVRGFNMAKQKSFDSVFEIKMDWNRIEDS